MNLQYGYNFFLMFSFKNILKKDMLFIMIQNWHNFYILNLRVGSICEESIQSASKNKKKHKFLIFWICKEHSFLTSRRVLNFFIDTVHVFLNNLVYNIGNLLYFLILQITKFGKNFLYLRSNLTTRWRFNVKIFSKIYTRGFTYQCQYLWQSR